MQLSVQRGDRVNQGDPLYTLEQENERSAQAEALERLNRAQAELENLKKGKRESELKAIEAQLAQAQANLKLSEAQLRRHERLFRTNFISKDQLDEARFHFERDQARIKELSAQLTTAHLAARPDEIQAAQAEVETARASLGQAEWRLAQKSVKAPLAGLVTDTLYVQGEWVSGGAPVIEILPPQNIKVRFFVPEDLLGGLRVDQPVLVRCDGCKGSIQARISYISPEAEYTPPVIYSRESRTKLVFLVEARPALEEAMLLHPGQPVEVSLSP